LNLIVLQGNLYVTEDDCTIK